jgi:hypothetical protein
MGRGGGEAIPAPRSGVTDEWEPALAGPVTAGRVPTAARHKRGTALPAAGPTRQRRSSCWHMASGRSLMCVAVLAAGAAALPAHEPRGCSADHAVRGVLSRGASLARAGQSLSLVPLRGGASVPPTPPGKPSRQGSRGRFGRRKGGGGNKPPEVAASSSQGVDLGCATTSRRAADPIVSIYQERRRKSISWQPSPSSDLHDDVNLVALFLLGFGAVAALAIGMPQHSIHTLLTYTGFIYILIDSLWIFSEPRIVKSPGMVGAHHIATLLVLLDPLVQPSHRVYTSACLLVEINTLLLLLRRKLSYAYVVEAPFIITWVMLRNVWYPLLLAYFVLCYSPTAIAPLLPASLQWLASFRLQLEVCPTSPPPSLQHLSFPFPLSPPVCRLRV